MSFDRRNYLLDVMKCFPQPRCGACGRFARHVHLVVSWERWSAKDQKRTERTLPIGNCCEARFQRKMSHVLLSIP